MRPTLFALAGLCALIGCSDVRLHEAEVLVEEVFTQAEINQVDVLLVVDNSGSMAEEQDELADHFDLFIEWLSEARTDYHVGVTTTDLENDRGRLRGVPAWITPETPHAELAFASAVQVGTGGDSREQGLGSALEAFSASNLAGPNAGFLREGAALALIFVSDEDDSSAHHWSYYYDAFVELKRGQVPAAHGLVAVDEDSGEPADCWGPMGQADAGWGYVEIADATGGLAAPICSDDFAPIVERMGELLVPLVDRFELSRRPLPDTLELTVFIPGTPHFASGGVEVPPEGVDGELPWSVLEAGDRAWLQFTSPHSIPPEGTRLEVRYVH